MKSRRQLGWVLAALVLVSLSAGNLFGQSGENAGIPTDLGYPNHPNGPADAGTPSNDPPARVARIQYISGEVSMQPGGVNDWVAANLNRPLTTSDRVWADKDSRVELNVGTGFIRLSSETSLTLTNVSDNTVQLQLDQGTLELTVRHLEPGEVFEIDTPNLAFTVMKSGVYRIDVPPNENQTWVTARKGNGEATGQGPAVKVTSGEQVRFSGQGSLQNNAYAAPAPDGFDDWAQVRDKRLEGSLSAQYVAPGVIGREDLDYYGTWRVAPSYGAIWVPTSVAAGWAPYRYGHWAWIAPWGWTWVDDAPWGFAPFHYGRWVSYGGYWGWAPGPAYVGWRPYYAPALVGWVGGAGWGFGVSFGIGFGVGGGCGWFPLGWGEPYYPWYHGYHGGYVSNTYIKNVNVTNTHITNITNVTNNYYNNTINNTHYVNRTVAGAVTAAPKSALQYGQNIAHAGMAVPKSQLNSGQVLRNVDVAPTRQAMLGGHAPLTTGTPPRSAVDRPVVTHNAPPARGGMQQPLEAHNPPAAPASLGVHSPANPGAPSQQPTAVTSATNASGSSATTTPVNQAGTQHVVPKPPNSGGRAPAIERDTAATASHATTNVAVPAAHNDVPKPAYAGGHAPAATEAVSHPNTSASPAAQRTAAPHESPHVSASNPPASHNANPPASHNEKPAQPSKENKAKEPPKANPGMASSNAPRPPAGYSYHAAPAYTASSFAAGSSYNAGSRSYSANTTPYAANRTGYSANPAPYTANRSSYSAPAPAYHAGYTTAPSYTARVSAPAAPHYSAPSYSGGGHPSGGVGHASSSGGSSGGHHR